MSFTRHVDQFAVAGRQDMVVVVVENLPRPVVGGDLNTVEIKSSEPSATKITGVPTRLFAPSLPVPSNNSKSQSNVMCDIACIHSGDRCKLPCSAQPAGNALLSLTH